MRKHIVFSVAGLFVLAFAAPAAAAGGDYFLKLQAIGETNPRGGCIDCQGTTLSASGFGECAICIAGKPTGGTVSIVTTAIVTKTCKVKSTSGPFDVKWNDGTTSTADVTGKLRGSSLRLSGAFPSTDPTWPSDPVKIVLKKFPPSPCLAASDHVIGAVEITTG
jgi:hypothetical protein